MDTTAASTSSASSTASSAEPGPLKVAVILGSNRDGRFGPVVADWFLARAAGHPGVATELIDVAEADLPTAITFSPGPEEAARLAAVSERLAAADAFVVVTPEYNHSFPAPLKSLIDWHSAEWQAKPVAFVSYGGISGGLRAVEQLRQVFAELHTVTVRDTVSFHNAGVLFDDEGRHLDPEPADAAAKTLLDQLVWWGTALRDARNLRPYGA
ncbi:NADPH-dependent FMN reductase [Streptomyces fimicarius]|uniref:NADPH-dependent FMN reductase n=1 Tax=Streptomyces TaxID=1883 RepID=UPI001C4FF8E2|nr:MULTISPECIES: NAD(P)H-dependent oxidoreductase [Streptomyces]WSV21030.1 NAD(P)H-dependent oxidoreductase [Streptomyces fimicarius]MCL6286970.1 NAD(P)H-dependent oxidoreductase [Streptomyces sp. 43Y-GA-1]MCX4708641.1 NAD(P)H-dependent oxidoreductase [Streptomyces griseus]MDX3337639.1 NAD(P)H-dependent oxidoreductase [Streptomyces sp. ME02-6979.5a]MDX3590522.1 NAD(P)H-dependent oxidoreductase [Streptomyces sp. ID03-2B]